MNRRTGEMLRIMSGFGQRSLLVAVTALGVHLFVMALDFHLVKRPLLGDPGEGFLAVAFSLAALPIVAGYTAFSILLYYSWNRMKMALIRTGEKELQEEKQRAAVDSMQRVAGLLSHYITRHNNDIQMWLAKAKARDGSAPETVERASRNIALAMGALSEIAFLAGDQAWKEGDIVDEGALERVLSERMEQSRKGDARELAS